MTVTVDWLEVVRLDNTWAVFTPDERELADTAALMRTDVTGVVRERLSDGTIGRSWQVFAERTHRLLDERRVVELEAVA